jgi:hypothetical protein
MRRLFKMRGSIVGLLFLLVALFALPAPESGARKGKQGSPPPETGTTQIDHFGLRYIRHGLDINDFRIPMTNYAIFGQFIELGAAGGEWPKGSQEYYIFGAGIWVGGNVNRPSLQTLNFSNLYVGVKRDSVLYTAVMDTSSPIWYRSNPRVVVGYNPSGGRDEFSGLTHIFISDHPEDYPSPDFWPLVDDQGDPIILGMEDSYTEFDDQDITRWDTGINSNAGDGVDIATFGLGVKVIQRTHSWNYEENKTIHFFKYNIINIREDMAPIRNCFVSVMCDADVGRTANDDLVGFDHSRNLGYAYDHDFSEVGFGRMPGFLTYVFLQSPLATYDVDLNGDDQISPDSLMWNDVWVKDVRKGEPLGLTSFKTSNLQSGDPDTEPEKYLIIAGHNYPETGDQRYAPFDLGTGTTPVDQRFFQNTGPFLLAPVGRSVIDTVWKWDFLTESLQIASIDTIVGDTVNVIVAVFMAPDLQQIPKIAEMARFIYEKDYLLPRPPDAPEIAD